MPPDEIIKDRAKKLLKDLIVQAEKEKAYSEAAKIVEKQPSVQAKEPERPQKRIEGLVPVPIAAEKPKEKVTDAGLANDLEILKKLAQPIVQVQGGVLEIPESKLQGKKKLETSLPSFFFPKVSTGANTVLVAVCGIIFVAILVSFLAGFFLQQGAVKPVMPDANLQDNGTGNKNNGPDGQIVVPCSNGVYSSEVNADGLLVLDSASRLKLKQKIEDVGDAAFSGLQGMDCLQDFFIGGTDYLREERISDISFLSGFPNLEKAELNSRYITDISPLSGLEKIRELSLRYSHVSDVSPIASMKGLEELDLESTDVFDVSKIAGMQKLRILNIGRAKIVDISSLDNLPVLEELYIYDNFITDLSPLANFKGLKRLGASNLKIKDISALTGLSILEDLNLFMTDVSDLRPLAGLSNLKKLNLKLSRVSDISRLLGLNGLEFLDVSQSYVSQQDCVRLQKALLNTVVNC